jgi:hypothetical protein
VERIALEFEHGFPFPLSLSRILDMRLPPAENDDLTGSRIAAGLRQAGFVVDWARDGRGAHLAAKTGA